MSPSFTGAVTCNAAVVGLGVAFVWGQLITIPVLLRQREARRRHQRGRHAHRGSRGRTVAKSRPQADAR